MPIKRFHTDARRTVLLARDNARRLGSGQVRTEHLLLALLEVDANPAREALERHGLTYGPAYDMVRKMSADPPLDAEALEAIGIDLEAVRGKLESAFGKGVLDTPKPGGRGRQLLGQDARKTLELSLRESLLMHANHISTAHILLGLIRADDGAVRILRQAGIDPKVLQQEVRASL